tara:strand:- start:46766 stop:47068 length:303 start_codon:yes stop_codon:yes gene_type:complete
MREYMQMDEADVSYDESHIQTCDGILDDYLAAIAVASDRKESLLRVKQAVVRLNKLNASCGHELIETDQREYLCDVIIRAAALTGFIEADSDVTEKWREW